MEPDVKVRLTAEGIDEVIKAFNRILKETNKVKEASDKSQKGLAAVAKFAGKTKQVLQAVGATMAVKSFVDLAKQSFDLADGLVDLNQATGISVSTLSVLTTAAKIQGIEQDKLGVALQRSAKFFDAYNKGAKSARDTVSDLFGGNSKALKGMGGEQQLLAVLKRIGEFPAGFQRAAAAQTIFGRGAAELMPLIDDLANRGFAGLTQEAIKLGQYLDDNSAKSLEQAKEQMKRLELQVEGLTLQISTGLAPAVLSAAGALAEAITDESGAKGMKKLGEKIGEIIRGIIAWFFKAGEIAANIFGGIGIEISRTFGAINDLIHGRFREAMDVSKKIQADRLTLAKVARERYQKQLATLYKNPDIEPLNPKDKPPSSEDMEERLAADTAKKDRERLEKEAERLAEKQRKADMDLAAARLDYDAKIAAAEAKAQEAAAKERYEQGLTSLRDYYAERIRIAETQGQAEAKALYDKVVELQSAQLGIDELQAERDAKILKAAADYQTRILENEAELKALRTEEAKETKELQDRSLDFEKRIREAQISRFAAARAEIDSQAAELDEILKKQGVSAGERAQRVGAYRDAGYQPIDFEEQASTASAALDEIEARRREIARQVASGQSFAYQAEQEIMALEQERLPLLQQIADAMRAAAITPEQVQAAEDFQEQIEELALSSNKAALEMGQFKQDVEGALTTNLTTWLSSSINQAESLGDAFRSLALSIVQSLQQIAAQMLANLMIQKMLGVVTGAAGGTTGAGSVHAASGGLIRGPGTGTSDSIPARLSNFEYVVRAAVVKKPGMLELLNTLNYGTPAIRRRTGVRFADGGLVDVPADGTTGGSAGLTATLGLDEGLLLKKLEASPQFHRVFVRMAQNNQKAMRQALGG